MKKYATFVAGLIMLMSSAFGAGQALAGVRVVVDKSEQSMLVYVDGQLTYRWDVSTGKHDRWTPNGTFGVQWMDANHYSSRYHHAPMPYSVFFNGNVAIHGTATANYQYLGQRASHGCVRLRKEEARAFFNLVQEVGRSNVIIIVQT